MRWNSHSRLTERPHRALRFLHGVGQPIRAGSPRRRSRAWPRHRFLPSLRSTVGIVRFGFISVGTASQLASPALFQSPEALLVRYPIARWRGFHGAEVVDSGTRRNSGRVWLLESGHADGLRGGIERSERLNREENRRGIPLGPRNPMLPGCPSPPAPGEHMRALMARDESLIGSPLATGSATSVSVNRKSGSSHRALSGVPSE